VPRSHHLRPIGGREGHHHRGHAAAHAAASPALCHHGHDARAASHGGGGRELPLPGPPGVRAPAGRGWAPGSFRGARQLVRHAPDQVQAALASGRDAILKIDVQGAHKVRQKVRDALLIFVVPPRWKPSRRASWVAPRRRRPTSSDASATRSTSCPGVRLRSRRGHETDQIDRTAEEIDAIIADEHARYPDRRIVV